MPSARASAPYAVVHRGDLHGRCSSERADSRPDRSASQLEVILTIRTARRYGRLASGERVTGSLLIAAGLWSNIRNRSPPTGRRVSGHTTYRSVIPTGADAEDVCAVNAATLWAARMHIVHYPLSGWKVFNLVVTYHTTRRSRSRKPVSEDEVMARVWARAPARADIHSHGKTGNCGCCATAIRFHWVDGRVTLLAMPRTR